MGKMTPDPTTTTEVVAESGRARLLRLDGKLVCECPYACLAVSERCEFDGKGYE